MGYLIGYSAKARMAAMIFQQTIIKMSMKRLSYIPALKNKTVKHMNGSNITMAVGLWNQILVSLLNLILSYPK